MLRWPCNAARTFLTKGVSFAWQFLKHRNSFLLNRLRLPERAPGRADLGVSQMPIWKTLHRVAGRFSDGCSGRLRQRRGGLGEGGHGKVGFGIWNLGFQ